MSAADESAELAAYFREAAGWDQERLASYRSSVRRAWQVAAAAGLCAVACALGLILLLPLKRVEPFLIRVDSSSGIVDVVPIYTAHEQMPQAVTRYFLSHYVLVCERFDYATAESDYEQCGAFHTAQRNQAWYALWNRTNPDSPLNLHKDGSSVSVQIESVSFFKRASGVSDLAQVRYLQIEHPASSAQGAVSHWIATVQYAYTAPSADPRLRGWNPLGFKIVNFVAEPEVLRERPEGVSPPVAGAPP
ncbi:MAG: virB8 family protein [Steroidobacteraceae bacterium]